MATSDKRGAHRFGFVACLGRTNVGKSTLINRLLGQKVGIVSKKPQTTRRRVRGILNLENAQIVLVDTPGLHGLGSPVNIKLEKEARQGVEGADCVLAITDPTAKKQKGEEEKLLSIVRQSGKSSLLFLNKCDLIAPSDLERLLGVYRELRVFRDVIAVSAKTGENLHVATDAIVGLLPEGPALFPHDIISDQPVRDFFAEIIREKIFRNVHQEMPYAAAVVIENVSEDSKRSLCRINATIYVERDSQKGILIGQGGKAMRKIGTDARRDMERLTGSQVHLSLWVKVRKNWTKDPKALREFGFE